MLLHFSYGFTARGDGASWDAGGLKTWRDEQGLTQLSSGSACFLPVRLWARGSQPREDHVNFEPQKKMKEEKISATSNCLSSFLFPFWGWTSCQTGCNAHLLVQFEKGALKEGVLLVTKKCRGKRPVHGKRFVLRGTFPAGGGAFQ